VNDYLLLMHDDAPDRELAGSEDRWASYLGLLQASGRFDGGSSIGTGALYSRGREPAPVAGKLSGFLRIRAASLQEASGSLAGDPVYEAGGTVELRELPRD
jgi:hypothetical protein